MKSKLLAAALAVLAAALIAGHLRMPRSTRVFWMDGSEAAARSGETINMPLPGGSVDVNHASALELCKLNGVGPSLAQAIVNEREQNGLFHHPEDLINVSGIGEKTLERMRDQLRLP